MTLAQVVYTMSNDSDFATQLFSSPETTLSKRGWKLSNEELDFLLTAHKRGDQTKLRLMDLVDAKAVAWRA